MIAASRRKYLAGVAVFASLVVILQLSTFGSGRWDSIREHASSIIRPPARSPSAPIDSKPDLPRDYFVESDNQRQCEQFYGLSYIQNLAKKEYQYCEDGSRAWMKCFVANRIQGPWESDPMCLARGATLSRESSTPKFTLPCRLRNFTQEAERYPDKAAEYAGVQNVEQFGSYYFWTGAGEEFQTWSFEDQDGSLGCSPESNNGQWIVLAKRENNANIWHKLMEIWQAMISVEALRIARHPETGELYMSPEEAAGIRVVFEDDRLEPLDDWWTIVTGNKPVRLSDMADGCYGNVLVPLAGSSSPFWVFLLETRQHEVCHVRTLIDAFVRRIMAHLGVDPRMEIDVHPNPVVTIIDRKQTRKFKDLDGVVGRLQRRYPHVQLNVVDFAAISLVEQVRLLQDTDVLVGHHGAGMTHVLFLPPEAAVVEIFPPVFPSLGFRHVARMRGLTHFVGHSLPYEEWNAAVHGTPLPDGWTRPTSEAGWQEAEWTYMSEDEFVGLVDAGIRSQMNRKPIH